MDGKWEAFKIIAHNRINQMRWEELKRNEMITDCGCGCGYVHSHRKYRKYFHIRSSIHSIIHSLHVVVMINGKMESDNKSNGLKSMEKKKKRINGMH